MSSNNTIEQNLALIQSAVYGKDVRSAIHDSIEQCYTDVSTSATRADIAAATATSAASSANTAATSAENAATAANVAAAAASVFHPRVDGTVLKFGTNS